jgi:O-antigen/teichoic acid export membrane protein
MRYLPSHACFGGGIAKMRPEATPVADGPPERPLDAVAEMSSVARGGLAFGASTVIVLLLGLPTTALLIRALGIRGYGSLAFAIGLTGLATTLADLGLSTGVMRMSAATEQAGETRWARSGLLLATASGALAMVVVAGIALTTDSPAREILLAASPLPLVMTVRASVAAFLRARRRIVLVEGSIALGQVLYSAGAFTLIALGLATASRVAALRWVAFGSVVLVMLPIWRRLAARRGEHKGTWRRLLAFSLPLLMGSVAWLVLQRSDVIMLGFFRGTRAVGIYSPILQVVALTSLVSTPLGTYYVPAGTRMAARGDLPGLRWLYATLTKWGVLLAAPLLCALIVAPRPFLHALFGPVGDAPSAALVARILAIGYAAATLTGQNGLSLTVLGKTRAIATRSVLALLVNLAVNLVLIPRLGPVGAAIGTSVVYVGLNLANSLLIWKIARLHPIRTPYLLVLAVAVAMTLLSLLTVSVKGWGDSLSAFILTFVAVGLGCLTTWLITSSHEERRSLLSTLSRKDRQAIERAAR